jgi:DegV family protein with EDD domain
MSFKKIKIMTDSVCDIPDKLLKEHNIGVIPCYVNFEGNSYADDGKEFDRDAFYTRLPDMKEFPTTAAPSPALAEKMLEEAIEGYDYIVSINVPEKLSATLNNIKLGAQKLGDRVTVLDSGFVTMGIGMQALVAAEIAAKTGDVAAVVNAVEQCKKNQKLYAIISELEYLRRSGRVNSIAALFGSLLQIKPILDVHDGEVEVEERVRTFKKAMLRLKELVQEQGPLDRLAILHIQNKDGVQELIEMLGDIIPHNVITVTAGPTLGTHIGPGSLGVITLKRGWLG